MIFLYKCQILMCLHNSIFPAWIIPMRRRSSVPILNSINELAVGASWNVNVSINIINTNCLAMLLLLAMCTETAWGLGWAATSVLTPDSQTNQRAHNLLIWDKYFSPVGNSVLTFLSCQKFWLKTLLNYVEKSLGLLKFTEFLSSHLMIKNIKRFIKRKSQLQIACDYKT